MTDRKEDEQKPNRIIFVRGMTDVDWRPAEPVAVAPPAAEPGLTPAPFSAPTAPGAQPAPAATREPAPIPGAAATPWRRFRSGALPKIALACAILFLAFLLVKASLQNFQAEGASMMPGLQDGDHVIVNKLAYSRMDLGLIGWLPFYDSTDAPYLMGAPQREDVIVFKLDQFPKKFVKRIIGAPGDKVEIRDGHVILNSIVLDEPYANGPTECFSTCTYWVVPENSYFVLGDNRGDSLDSRGGWMVPADTIVGKVLLSY
jgi:signal peptidase I